MNLYHLKCFPFFGLLPKEENLSLIHIYLPRYSSTNFCVISNAVSGFTSFSLKESMIWYPWRLSIFPKLRLVSFICSNAVSVSYTHLDVYKRQKPLLERDLYHRTITSHFKRHKICGYRRTGLHAGIWTSRNHRRSPWNLRIQNWLSIHNKTEDERNSEKK